MISDYGRKKLGKMPKKNTPAIQTLFQSKEKNRPGKTGRKWLTSAGRGSRHRRIIEKKNPPKKIANKNRKPTNQHLKDQLGPSGGIEAFSL